MLSRAIMIASVATAGVLATAQAHAQSADAVLVDSDGKTIGNVALSQLARGVRLFAQAADLPPGQHAFHIHETGACEPPDFESAGGHFNPTDEQHGWDNPQGYHAGDFPNIHVQDDGRLAVEYFTDAVTLRDGEETSVFDDDGAAIVIHAGADDYRTEPAGAAGERIACGVISPSG